MNSIEKLTKKLNDNKHICVGLDTDINKIPKHLLNEVNPVFEFNKAIIENTSDDATCYKINLAFYERDGVAGLENLEKTLELIPEDVFVIGDAKRGDIGNTSDMYAKSIYEHFKFDSITLHPYMGYDSVQPFLEYEDKINFILALTSNKGNADFEKQLLQDGSYLFQKVIKTVNSWNGKKNCGIVFGATNPQELEENVETFEDLFVLLPGVGAQGGSLEDVAKTFSKKDNNKYIVNVSRALLYADNTERFGVVSNEVLKNYNRTVLEILNNK
ncbi:MAG: orotidine-5'-phosphate decarboxylase [Melioribacteraceae bacterium]|nr:orotidine-5'-phosphate decarboxylase [Melioribacteraceae bacterium]